MKFLMFVCADPAIRAGGEEPGLTIEEWLEETARRGVRLEGDLLRGISDATSVRDNGALISDGPFADTKEWIAGYDVLDCADLAEAIEIASKHPMAEVRRDRGAAVLVGVSRGASSTRGTPSTRRSGPSGAGSWRR